MKEPWRRSNRNQALGQMLVTNQRLDQLAAARTDFSNRGMLTGRHVPGKFNFLIFIPSLTSFPDLAAMEAVTAPRSSKPPVQTSILDEDPLEEAETNPNAQPGVRLALRPSEF